ncbi:MAG: hypothetical protein JNK98_08150, partial [Chitinophagaceae bacterium]|nr:hypothetical protein [Chitinophagaceae bacterium]
VGLVEVDKEIAVHQIVEFTAVVSPAPSSSLTYDWKVTQGNASISNPSSKDARVTALETGMIQITVTVKDNNGVVLGNASGAFNATISNEMTSNSAKMKKDFDDKMAKARQYLREGNIDEAVKLGLELKSMNAKEAANFINELVQACRKSATDATAERDFKLATKRCEQALQLNPGDNTAKTQLEQTKKWQQEWLAIEGKASALEASIINKNIPDAEKALNDIKKLQSNMPGKAENKWTKDKTDRFNALTWSYDSAYTSLKSMYSKSTNDKDFHGALKLVEEFNKEWKGTTARLKDAQADIQFCNTQIAEQNRIYDNFLVTKEKFEKGQPIDPKQTPAAIEIMAQSKFGAWDPRQKEMTDFAKTMDKKQKEFVTNKEKANQLKSEGQKAESAGNKEEALNKYKESIALVPDSELDNKIKKLETEIAAINAKRNKADALWNEGEQLAKKKKTKPEGLNKMKESLEWWNNPERIEKARELEKDVNGSYSKTDLSGIWKHGSSETFTFTLTGDNLYNAVEKGFGNANGSVTMIGQLGIINYTTKDGTNGQYILKVTADGSSGTGKWT